MSGRSVERRLADLIASAEMEGGTPSDRAKDLARGVLAGEISGDDAVAQLNSGEDLLDGGWTNSGGATFYLGMANMDWVGDPTAVAFSITLYGDGTLAIGGKEPKEGNAGLAHVLRLIADEIERDTINWREYPRP